MSDWNPALYRRFEDERTRPARDLLSRVPDIAPKLAIDLGCGPGNSTELLVQRFPEARVVGTDTSESMLSSARERLPQCTFELADVATWVPRSPPDLIFANAVLQWVPDHASLLPRLFSLLAPGGVLAVQMPNNLNEPSHRAMRELASREPWAASIGNAGAVRVPILPVTEYYDLLAGDAAQVDVWQTAYQHPMDSARAIVDWLRATGLRPFLDSLPETRRESFLSEYEALLDEAYPARIGGKHLLAFPRLFIVASHKL